MTKNELIESFNNKLSTEEFKKVSDKIDIL